MPQQAPGERARVRILNVDVDDVTFEGLLSELRMGVVFTPNVDHIMKLQRDARFYGAYARADWRLCDSRIVQWASGWVAPEPIREQVAGSDFFPAFCRHHARRDSDVRLFLLGGSSPEILERAVAATRAGADRELVVGAYSPPFGFERQPEENARILERIRTSGANTLAVGVGAPKQELWIDAHRNDLPEVRLFFAVGATIDFMGGGARRAPRWMTRCGIEWAHRLLQEPRRMAKRYLVDDLPFFRLVWRQRRGRYRDPFAGREGCEPSGSESSSS